jgi:glutamate-5-semialdehyde dehydrogenase
MPDTRTTAQQAIANTLTAAPAGMAILYDGNKLARVPPEVAARFQPGDRLLVESGTGAVLHVPASTHELVGASVDRAQAAFSRMGQADDRAVTRFYDDFAARLSCDETWRRIAEANALDVAAARERGRSTTRLAASEKLRGDMIRGLEEWRDMPAVRGAVTATVQHEGWTVEQVVDGLGVVGFVFEGRPNVFADATGILRSGNTAVLRIGSDALCTAREIDAEALQPAIAEAGLPSGCISLIDSPERAAGWALFSDRRLGLAIARGSGRAVAQLGSIARQSGIPVSLHGTGGAWLVADDSANLDRFAAAVFHSIDRKVCNTTNVILVVRPHAAELIPVALDALRRRGEVLGTGFKLHVVDTAAAYVPCELFEQRATIQRAEGLVNESVAELLPLEDLGREWEWEATPEVTLGVVDDLDTAIQLFNTYSPHFIASLIADDPEAQDRFFSTVDAPFVGDGFTRWVDGQYALSRPELGLSNWQGGRLIGRGGILSGDGVYAVRLRVRQHDPDLHR